MGLLRMNLKIFAVIAIGIFLSGCSPTRKLDVTAQERTTKQVTTGKFELEGLLGGKAKGEISGEKFAGSWSGMPQASTINTSTSGTASGYVGGSPVSGTYQENSRSSQWSKTIDASLMLTGDKGTCLSCQFKTFIAFIDAGQGTCQDNRGAVYDFHF